MRAGQSQYACSHCWHTQYLTKPIDMVASANGSPIMLAILNLLRLEEFMLDVFNGFFSDGEYSDL